MLKFICLLAYANARNENSKHFRDDDKEDDDEEYDDEEKGSSEEEYCSHVAHRPPVEGTSGSMRERLEWMPCTYYCDCPIVGICGENGFCTFDSATILADRDAFNIH